MPLSVRRLLVLIACTNQVPVLSVLHQPEVYRDPANKNNQESGRPGRGGGDDDACDNGGGRRRHGAHHHVQPARQRPTPRQ